MTHILVTGAGGFIGQHCVRQLLAKDFEVHAVSRTPHLSSGVVWHLVNLFDPASVAELLAAVRPTHLLHLAWCTTPGEYWTSSDNLRWVQASIDLFQEFLHNGGQRIVVAGTCAEYDWSHGICSESLTPLIPSSCYGATKHALQIVLMALSRQTDLSAAWGRIFWAFGPGEPTGKLTASVTKSLLQNQPIRCTNGEQIRDFLYVEDVADAFVALVASDICGAVNIASGVPTRVKEVVQTIGQILDREELIELGAILPSADEPPLLLADTQRLRRELGWVQRHDLKTGVAKTVEWWRHQEPRFL